MITRLDIVTSMTQNLLKFPKCIKIQIHQANANTSCNWDMAGVGFRSCVEITSRGGHPVYCETPNLCKGQKSKDKRSYVDTFYQMAVLNS